MAQETTPQTFDPDTLYVVMLNQRLELPEHRLTLYPGKEYHMRGDLLAANASKVVRADPIPA